MEDNLTLNQKLEELEELNKSLVFYSDQVRFNSIMYQGITLILDKLSKIEEKLGINDK